MPTRDYKPILNVLVRLHNAKQKVYGDSWRRRGELVSIFGNISRKYDRLEEIMQGGAAIRAGTPDETVIDTVADLACYATLYCSWLTGNAPLRDEGFGAALRSVEHIATSADLETMVDCAHHWRDEFTELEAVLVPDAHVPALLRLAFAVDIAAAALVWLSYYREAHPEEYADWAAKWIA